MEESAYLEPILKRAIVSTARTLGVDPDEVLTEAADWASKHAGSMVTGLSTSEQNAVSRTITRAVERGWDQARTAQAVQRIVGLGPRDAQAVDNLEQGLLKQNVPPGKARAEANRYARRLHSRRASVIGNHEVANAIAYGKRLAWRQRQTMGDLRSGTFRIVNVHRDDRQCEICKTHDGRTIPLHLTDVGPPWHVGCRCWETLSQPL